jgi:MOSC domain-containing protein YiiM
VQKNLTQGEVVAVCLSAKKGTKKDPVPEVTVVKGHGVKGDAHAGPWHRQVSLLAEESVAKMREKGITVGPGGFAENILTRGLKLVDFPKGTRLQAGDHVVLKITQIGKVCHERCAIYYQAGDCVMPREGVFAEVLVGGTIRPGDLITVMPKRKVETRNPSEHQIRISKHEIRYKSK